ncbi:MAG: low affinity iron permease family protein [Phycisphaerales bacterium]
MSAHPPTHASQGGRTDPLPACPPPSRHGGPFRRCASAAAHWSGHPAAFLSAVGIVIAWAAFGPVCHFSDTWQLVINTGTTIVTFLMVFLIQNAQNRDTAAMQIKLDELIRAVHGARNNLIDVEQMEEAELIALRDRFHELAQQARVRSEPPTQEDASQRPRR